MKNRDAVFLITAAGLLAAIGGGYGLATITGCGYRLATITAAPTARYEEVADWPALPADVQMGEAAGVAVDKSGHVFVFHRPGRGFDTAATETLKDAPVLEIDADTGRLIRAWGEGTFLVPTATTTSSSPTWGCTRCSSTRTTAGRSWPWVSRASGSGTPRISISPPMLPFALMDRSTCRTAT